MTNQLIERYPVGALVVGPFSVDGEGWPQINERTGSVESIYGPGLGVITGHRPGERYPLTVKVLTGSRMSGSYGPEDMTVVRHPANDGSAAFRNFDVGRR